MVKILGVNTELLGMVEQFQHHQKTHIVSFFDLICEISARCDDRPP